VNDLEVIEWLIQLVQIPYDVWNRAGSVPLAWILVIQETHTHNILDGKSACLTVRVVVDQFQHLHV